MTEGEAWARGLLSELRADGYRARAWLGFLACSFERAHTNWRQRPRERRQVFGVAVAGFAGWGVVALVRPWLAVAGALWWLVVIAMLGWHLGMLEDKHGRPLPRLGLANLLSLARLAAVPALPVASPALLAAILIPAGVTDVIDGAVARRRQEATRLGVWLDGSADTLLLSTAALGAARHGLLPWWIAAVVIARHAAPWLLVSLAYFIHTASPQIDRPVSGKVAGLILFAGLLLSAFRLPGGVPLVLAGATAGLATWTVRVGRAQPVRARLGLSPPA